MPPVHDERETGLSHSASRSTSPIRRGRAGRSGSSEESGKTLLRATLGGPAAPARDQQSIGWDNLFRRSTARSSASLKSRALSGSTRSLARLSSMPPSGAHSSRPAPIRDHRSSSPSASRCGPAFWARFRLDRERRTQNPANWDAKGDDESLVGASTANPLFPARPEGGAP